MSHAPTPKPKGRHRAAPPSTDPANVAPLDSFFPTEQLPIVGPKKPQTRRERRELEAAEKRAQHHKAARMATGSLLVVSAAGGAVGLQSTVSQMRNTPREISAAPAALPMMQDAVLADAAAITFERPNVGTVAAPPPPPPPPPVAVAPKPAPVVRVDAVTPAPPPPKPAAPVGTKAAAIANAALAQVGVYQDCTMLVTNSLKAVGISFHDWPAGYFSLGTTVPYSQAVPGDLIWYDDGGSASLPGWDHIAVYIGNGKAVHGGFNGNQTVIFSMNVGSGPGAFIRVA